LERGELADPHHLDHHQFRHPYPSPPVGEGGRAQRGRM